MKDTSKTKKNQNDGISIIGNVNTEGDIVGRDKIIHNIIVVGKFLDYAQVDGLIPNLGDLPKLESISAAFEPNFKERLGSDLTNATSVAGEILEPILESWTPTDGKALPYRDILKSLAQPLTSRIVSLNYWDVFCDTKYISFANQTWSVLWLTSLSLLWKKYRRDKWEFGLIRKEGAEPRFIYQIRNPNLFQTELVFDNFTREEFRIFLVGIMLDLIRMASLVSNDIDFWRQLIDSLSPNTK